MKLLCVTEIKNLQPGCIAPIVGEEYTAADELEHEGIEYWLIEELQNMAPKKSWYDKRSFVPLNGPDETTYSDQVMSKIYINQKNTQHVKERSGQGGA